MAARSKKKNVFGIILGGSLLFVLLGCIIFLFTGRYPADEEAVSAMASADQYTITELDDGTMTFVPENPKAGLIFYPGAKVELEAYAPLMSAFAEQEVLCVLVSMPFDLAFLDANAADGIQSGYPEIDQWYLAGHSLGGSMAASYAAKHPDAYEGLFLLASYSLDDLSNSGLKVLSLYGSEDRVLNPEHYETYRSNLPEDTEEYIIEGGCHAYFGSYGTQDGDGIPTISNQEQIQITADRCLAVMAQQ